MLHETRAMFFFALLCCVCLTGCEKKDAAAVEEAVYEALSSALSQVKAEAAGRLSEATGGLKIPGFPA